MSDYVDGDLSPSLRTRLERHLGECEECRRLLEGLRRTLEMLHGVSGLGEGVDAAAIAASVRVRLSEPG
jgi:anti-sigma factor RsiW